MERYFRDIPPEKIEESDQEAFLVPLVGHRGDTWSQLLASPRVVLISEAGSGKTYECKNQAAKMQAAGQSAFYLELTQLAQDQLRSLLTPAEECTFDTWLQSTSESATFFLDAYDELRLTVGSFRLALNKLAKETGGRHAQVRIVVTSRPVGIDLDLLKKAFPYREVSDGDMTAESFANAVTVGRRKRTHRQSKAAPVWRTVALVPLDVSQIKELATSEGVMDADALVTDIQRRSAEQFARRPQDLIELCADWKESRSVRTHLEQMRSNVRTKITAQTTRPEHFALSTEEALSGAKRVALASLLCKKLTIRHSKAEDEAARARAALNPGLVLTGWPPEKLATLLERPIFSFASYGRVRFHHRSVAEYLAAEEIHSLTLRGMPIKTAKRLLFANTAQGQEVIRPSMRATAAWLALFDKAFFDEVLRRDPCCLLNDGDPESLDGHSKARVLSELLSVASRGGWRGIDIPSVQVRRIADPRLAPIILETWNRGIENPEMKELCLEIVEAGSLTNLSDLAYRVAMAESEQVSVRLRAIGALVALNDHRVMELVDSMRSCKELWPDRLLRWAVARLFPTHIPVDTLCTLLMRFDERPKSTNTISWHLVDAISSDSLSDADLDDLRIRLTGLIREGTVWNRAHARLKLSRGFLVPMLAAACLRGLRTKRAGIDVFDASVLCLRGSDRGYGHQQLFDDLHSQLNATHVTRRFAFERDWALLAEAASELDASDLFAQILFEGPVQWDYSLDQEWVKELLSDRSQTVEKREAILNVLLRLSHGQIDSMTAIAQIAPLVQDAEPLVARLESYFRPNEDDGELARMQAEAKERQVAEQRRSAEVQQSWKSLWSSIVGKSGVAFADDQARITAWNLWSATERAGHGEKTGGWDRAFIQNHFGREVADNCRLAMMAAWRNKRPTVRSERSTTERNVSYAGWRFGLAGLYAESEDREWASKLSVEEVELALRYALEDVNGFPSWLEDLTAAWPNSCEHFIGRELTAELEEEEGGHSWMLQRIVNARGQIAILLIPRIEAWLSSKLCSNEKSAAKMPENVAQAAEVLLILGSSDVRSRLRAYAERELRCSDAPPPLWFATVIVVDPSVGIELLCQYLEPMNVERSGLAVQLLGVLFGEGRGAQVNLSVLDIKPSDLLKLIRLVYRHVRLVDDAIHEDAYTPDDRDHAERARDAILGTLLRTPGQAGWNAKLALADDPLFGHFKDRARAVALGLAADEADSAAYSEEEVSRLGQACDVPPKTPEAMYQVLVDRLDDIEERLLEDDSPASVWALVRDEVQMRRVIARELRTSARNAYTVDQEAVTADEKETDIRMRSTGADQSAVIELKIGEKGRSASELRASLAEQLVRKYMAARSSRTGCLLVTVATGREWKHPDTGVALDFDGLISFLRDEAQLIEQKLSGDIRLVVKGLDLRKRLATER